MKKSETKYVGFTSKLRVKEDCSSARGFGPLVILKKGAELICAEVEHKEDDILLHVLTSDEEEIIVFYDQVAMVDTPYDIQNTKPITNVHELYDGMELIVVGEKCGLGIGTKVLYSRPYGSKAEVTTFYDGNYYVNTQNVSLSELAIPNNEITKTELVANLIRFIENNEPLISKEKTIELLKTLQ